MKFFVFFTVLYKFSNVKIQIGQILQNDTNNVQFTFKIIFEVICLSKYFYTKKKELIQGIVETQESIKLFRINL